MRKITVVNEYPICPPKLGGQVRILNQYKYLSAYFDIDYICLTESGRSVVRNSITDNFTEIRVPKSALHHFLDRFSPHIMNYFYEQFISLNDILAIVMSPFNSRFKSVFCESAQNSDILISSHNYLYSHVKPFSDKLRIYEAHNVETSLKEQFLNYPLTRPLVNLVRKSEQEACDDCDILLATSNEDSQRFKEYFGVDDKIAVIPNTVDTNVIKPCGKEEKRRLRKEFIPSEQKIVLFIGSAHPPNVEAAKWIAHVLAPEIKTAHFFIAGSVCWLVENSPVPDNVTLFYEVDEEKKMRIYHSSDIAINPMSVGSGTNVKMLDYFAAGLPSVSTTVGARGLECEHGRDIIISELDNFPAEVKELLANADRCTSILKNARKLVENKFACDIVAARLSRLLNNKLENTYNSL